MDAEATEQRLKGIDPPEIGLLYDSCFTKADSIHNPLVFYYGKRGRQYSPYSGNIRGDSLTELYWDFIKIRDSICLYSRQNNGS